MNHPEMMTDQYVQRAEDDMGALERVIKGLPGIEGYVDKELRRDADKRLRETIVSELDGQKQQLFDIQKRLMKNGGLRSLDDVDRVIQKLQTLSDRVKSASQGYAGLFDAMRIGVEELNALHRFDVKLAEQTNGVKNAVDGLAAAVDDREEIEPLLDRVDDVITDLSTLFQKRNEAILDPNLLTNSDYVPDVPVELLGVDRKETSES
ncbi:hypothetical protein KFU94_37645 [Chloroflexi bacterium TSY]|nr:hypothetical protein [Chloroflexi bacterium TSY]